MAIALGQMQAYAHADRIRRRAELRIGRIGDCNRLLQGRGQGDREVVASAIGTGECVVGGKLREQVRAREVHGAGVTGGHISETVVHGDMNVERLTRDLIGKLLHEPSVNLKEIPNESDRFDYARMLNDIFLNTYHSKHDKE